MELTQAPWFEANPQLLQHELDALAALNIESTIDSELQSQGILQIGLIIDPLNIAFKLPTGIEPVQLKVTFPHNYPYFRPEVYGLNVALPRHQNPIEKNLCLLPRASKYWNVEWTLADFLQAQLGKVLEKGAITDAGLIAADSDEQAEPITTYYGGKNAPVIFDSTDFDAFNSSDAELTVLGRIQIGLPKQKIIPTRMAVLESATLDKKVLSSLPTVFHELFPVKFDGYALRLSERPPYGDPYQDLDWLKALLKKTDSGKILLSKPLTGLKENSTRRKASIKQVWALNIPEEVAPGLIGMGWIFLIEGTVETSGVIGKKTVDYDAQAVYYAQIARSGQQDTQIRVPRLTHLPECTVAIVGLGALGAPATIEFARNQVGGLRLMDFDTVDPATTVRWPLGATAFGQQKITALQEFIAEQYPRTNVQVIQHKVGKIPMPGEVSESLALNALLDGASLLFDASAEPGVNHFLSQEARRRDIPYISLYTTPGAWGGLIMRVVPGKTEGCWMCLQHAKDKSIPVPKSDADGEVQAPGCGDLTFTGASFDLQNVSLAAVRLAVSTLCADIEGGYPDVSWDVGVVSLVDDNNLPIPPTWQTFPLKADPHCPYCSIS